MDTPVVNNKVLIVDDMPDNLQLLSNILFTEGMEISFATNGNQALETIGYNKPDIILLDISMPGMDGYEVCEKLKANPETRNIPVIFLTARSSTEDKVKGFEAGAVDYVTKPFEAPELLNRVHTHLNLKNSLQLIAKQNESLKELNSTKDKFFSIIAHDLKSPFNSLLGFADLLYHRFDSYDKDKLLDYIRVIYNSSKNLYELLENLLEWSRTQTGKMEYNPELLDLKKHTEEVIQLLNGQADTKNISLQNKITANTLVYADANMLNAVFRNLISNAIKFSSAKQVVKVESIEKKDFHQIRVVDQGVGIEPHNIDKLFRIDSGFSTRGTAKEKGTGLGLVICKEFIERSGGEIWVESEPEKGTSFYFTMPKNKTDQETGS